MVVLSYGFCIKNANSLDKIYNENCLTGMQNIPDSSIDFVCTDLPYSITACDWDKGIDLKKFWVQIKRILKPQSSAAMFASGKFSFELAQSNWDWYKYKWIWVKNSPTCFVHAKNCPMHKYEEILIFSNGVINHESLSPNTRMKYFPQGVEDIPPVTKKWKKDSGVQIRGHKKCEGLTRFNAKNKFGGAYGARPSQLDVYTSTKTGYPSDVLNFNTLPTTKKLNPTQKPTELLEYLIRTYTNEGELVLDATIGSGSTAVACINTNRHFIGFETNKKFFDIANERIAKTFSENR